MKPALYILAGAVGFPLFAALAVSIILAPFLVAEWLGFDSSIGLLAWLPIGGAVMGWCAYRDAQRRKLHQMANW